MAQRGRGTLEVNPSKSPFFQTTTQTIGVDPYSRAEWNHHQITQQQQLTRYNNTNKKTTDPETIDSKMFDFLYSRESDRIGAKPDTLNSLKHQMETDDTKQLNQKSRIQQHHNNYGQHHHAHFASPQQRQLNRNQREEQQNEQDDERFILQQDEEEENRIRYEQDMMMEQQQQQQGSPYQSASSSRHSTAEEILAQYKHQPKAEHPRYLTSGNEYGRKPPTMATVVVERVPKKQDFSRSFGTMKPRNSSMNTAISKSTIHYSLDLQFL